MNILEITEGLKDLSDAELPQADAAEYLKQTEIKRRIDMRQRYQAQQQKSDDSKTVSEKQIEQLMGGIAGADPMAGQAGDPSLQQGIAGGMQPQGPPEGPPQGPPMMYGGGLLGYQEGGEIGDDELTEDEVVQALDDPSIPDRMKQAIIDRITPTDDSMMAMFRGTGDYSPDETLGERYSQFRDTSVQKALDEEGNPVALGDSGILSAIGPAAFTRGVKPAQYVLDLANKVRGVKPAQLSLDLVTTGKDVALRNPGNFVRTGVDLVKQKVGNLIPRTGGTGTNVARTGDTAVDVARTGGTGTNVARTGSGGVPRSQYERNFERTFGPKTEPPPQGIASIPGGSWNWRQAAPWAVGIAAGVGTEMSARPHRIPDPATFEGDFDDWMRVKTSVMNERRRQETGLTEGYQDYVEAFENDPARRYDDDTPYTFDNWKNYGEGQKLMKDWGEWWGGAGTNQKNWEEVYSEEDFNFHRERPEGFRGQSENIEERLANRGQSAADRMDAIATGDKVPEVPEDPEDPVDNALRLAIEEILGEGQSGLDMQMGYLDDAMGRVDAFKRNVQDQTLYKKAQDAELEAGTEELQRAKGMQTLHDARAEEQSEMLARELGMSEDRIRELMAEMDSPEELQRRKDAEFYSSFGAVAGGNPQDYAGGFKTVQDDMATLNDTLRSERKSALTGIMDERRLRMEAEKTGSEALYNTKLTGLSDWDTAKSKFDAIGTKILNAQADRNIAGEKEAMEAYVQLLKEKAIATGAWNNQAASANAAMEQAIATRDNPFANIKDMEALRMELDNLLRWSSNLDPNTPKGAAARAHAAGLENLVNAASAKSLTDSSISMLGEDPTEAPVTQLRTTSLLDRAKDSMQIGGGTF